MALIHLYFHNKYLKKSYNVRKDFEVFYIIIKKDYIIIYIYILCINKMLKKKKLYFISVDIGGGILKFSKYIHSFF